MKKLNEIFGFTLVELLVVVAVLGIILAIAVPAYQSTIANQRLTAELSGLRTDIEYARSEAIKQGLNVMVCASTDQTNCAGSTAWASGWIVFSTTGDCTSTTGTNLRIKDALPSTDFVTYTPKTGGNTSLCLNRYGLSAKVYTGKFVLTLADGSSPARCLTLSDIGMTQTLLAGQSDASGVSCP